ncbi:MAG: DUF1127 domain-containing protein [Alphaproteobacteria bacterium]
MLMISKTAPSARRMSVRNRVSVQDRTSARGRAAIAAALAVAASLVPLVLLWIRRAETRRALARLDAERLADVGIGEAEARRECRKPFWRA